MPISVSNPSNGSVMTWPAATFATMRTWVNSVPASDVTDRAVQREHLVRPTQQGWPVGGQSSDWYTHRSRSMHLDGPQAYDLPAWYTPERITLRGVGMDREGDVWVTPLGAPLENGVTHIRVSLSCVAQVRMDPDLWAPAGSLTNTATAVAELQIRGFEYGSGLEFTFSPGRATLHCGESFSTDPVATGSVGGTLIQKVELFACETFGFTTQLDHVYVVVKNTIKATVGTSDPLIDQIDLDRIHFDVEAF